MSCMCGDSECPSCGRAQGTLAVDAPGSVATNPRPFPLFPRGDHGYDLMLRDRCDMLITNVEMWQLEGLKPDQVARMRDNDAQAELTRSQIEDVLMLAAQPLESMEEE